MKVKELIKELKKLPQNEVVYYSDNNEFLDVDVVGHNPKEKGYKGFIILGKGDKWKLKS
mgnify:CR=1 FL=1